MSSPSIPVARIRNNYARRLAMIVVFPALILWHFHIWLLVFPLAVAWNAFESATRAAWESVRSDCSVPSMMLLRKAVALMWREPLG